MSDLKIQGEVEVSTEGVERSLDRVGTVAEGMARKVGAAADNAGKAVDEIGNGANKNAEEFTRAEGRMSASIARYTTKLENAGKTQSQIFRQQIDAKMFDPSKFEAQIVKLEELESAQKRIVSGSRGMGGGLQNLSYQLQDFVVQVNGGTDATRALSQQLPQALIGFGAAGAAVGVLAALLPNLVSAFASTTAGAKSFKDAMSDFDKAIGAVGEATKTFDMNNLYEEFNKSSEAVRAATIEQLNFQREYIRTTQLVSEKSFGKSLDNFSLYGAFDNMAGGVAIEEFSKKLGISVDMAKQLLPALKGLKSGTEDFEQVFNKFGTSLLAGNEKSVELAISLRDMSKNEREAAAASLALADAQEKMTKGHVQTKKEMEEAAKATKASAKATEELQALIDGINGKAAEFDSSYVKNVQTLLKAYDSGKLSLAGFNEVFSRYVAMQPGAVAAAKALAKAEQDSDKARQDYMRGIGDETARLLDKARAAEFEVQTIGLSADELGRLTAQRYDEQIAIKQAEADRLRAIDGRESEVYLIEQQISALQRLKGAEIAKPRLQEQAREWEKFTDDINRSLTDSLFRAFESGDSFGKAFAKSLENTFKTMALRLAVNYTVNGAGQLITAGVNAALGTSFGSSGGSSGSAVLGTANNLSTAYSLYNNAGILAQWAGGSMSSANALGTVYANATGTGLDGLLATNGAYGTAASSGTASGSGASASGVSASSVAWIAAIVAGMWMSSEAWKAGIRWENYAKDPGSQYDLETYMRASKDKPLAAIFGQDFVNSQFYAIMSGSALSAQIHYALKNALWGSTRVTGSQITGTFSEDQQGFTGQQGVSYKKSGGLFSKSKEWTDWTALPAEVDNAMDMIYRGVRNSFIMLGEVFDDTSLAAKLQGFAYSFTVGELSIESVANSLTAAMSGRLTPSINAAMKSGETWAQTFQRVLEETNAFQRAMTISGKSLVSIFGSNNLDGILKASDSFIALFGSIDNFNTAFSGYFANFYSVNEQVAQSWRDMKASFDQIGQVMPTTRQGFRDLVDSLDLSTESGRQTYAQLMGLQSAFAALTPTLEDAAAAAVAMQKASQEMQARQYEVFYAAQRKAAQDAISQQMSEATAAANTAASLIDAYTQIRDSLTGYRDSLVVGSDTTASPLARYEAAKSAFDTTSAQAKLGNVDAANQLQSVSDALLKASIEVSSSADYARDVAKVIGTLDQVIGVSDRQIPLAESQLQVANDQLTALQAILAQLSGNQTPVLVSDYQQAATDWAQFFTGTAIGDFVQTSAGTMQRISDTMGLLIDNAGLGFTFSQSDNPYTLANQSADFRQYLIDKYGQLTLPAFADGGIHTGGLRIVGEQGPELEFTGPSSIIDASTTSAVLGNAGALSQLVGGLLQEIAQLRSEQRAGHAAIASSSAKVARTLEKFDIDGMPEVRAA